MKINSARASRIFAIAASILVNISAAASIVEANTSQTPGKNLSSNLVTTKTIPFNGLGGTDIPGAVVVNPNWTIFLGGTVVTVDGFNFNGGGEHAIIGPLAGDDTGTAAWNGTDYMTGWGGITMKQSNDAPFTLNSIDLANAYDAYAIGDTVITGNLFGGGSVQQTLSTLSLNFTPNSVMQTGNDFTTYALTGFSNLSSVTMQVDGILALDNFNVSNVSEPQTYALLLVGLGFIAFMSRGGHVVASVNRPSSKVNYFNRKSSAGSRKLLSSANYSRHIGHGIW